MNNSGLPAGYYALAEQVAGNTVPDVLTLQGNADGSPESLKSGVDGDVGGVAVATSPPRTSVHESVREANMLLAKQKRIVIRHATGDRTVALLEIVSPGHKASRSAIDEFVDKVISALDAGLQFLMVDLFPTSPLDPDGMHGMIWGRLGSPYVQPTDKPLTLAAYPNAGNRFIECYVEPTAVGEKLIDMPLFLSSERYVNVPLEQTYLSAYEGVPKRWKQVIEGSVPQ